MTCQFHLYQQQQQMTPQFHLFQPNNNNNQNPRLMHHSTLNASGQPRSYSEAMHEDHLGRSQA
ncbi:hypothetical protein Bca52824_003529 [Brassica carinata]|uniref:Uncharacterized protein n=1 Tax=Brassica carinata TaxID=52824 RepID=A0A8X8BBJ0_BRACI|nr:hypothetical protein Bca52824_003529 [Brassica carinata]